MRTIELILEKSENLNWDEMGMWSGLWAFGGAAGAAKRSKTLKNGVKSEENRVAATK